MQVVIDTKWPSSEQPFFDMAGAFAGATIRQPSFFLMGKADRIAKMRAATEDGLC